MKCRLWAWNYSWGPCLSCSSGPSPTCRPGSRWDQWARTLGYRFLWSSWGPCQTRSSGTLSADCSSYSSSSCHCNFLISGSLCLCPWTDWWWSACLVVGWRTIPFWRPRASPLDLSCGAVEVRLRVSLAKRYLPVATSHQNCWCTACWDSECSSLRSSYACSCFPSCCGSVRRCHRIHWLSYGICRRCGVSFDFTELWTIVALGFGMVMFNFATKYYS